MIKKCISDIFILTAFIASASIQGAQPQADIKSHAEKSETLCMMIESAISINDPQLVHEIIKTYQKDFQDLTPKQLADLIDYSRSLKISNSYFQKRNNNLKQIRALLNTHASIIVSRTQKVTALFDATLLSIRTHTTWENFLTNALIDCPQKKAFNSII